MSQMIPEPPRSHLEDTDKIRPVREPIPAWRRATGLMTLIGAVVLTAATTLLMLTPQDTPTPNIVEPTAETIASPMPTDLPQETIEPTLVVDAAPGAIPTASDETINALLQQPLAAYASDGISIDRDIYSPFTIIPERPRNQVIDYVVEEGDTISDIAIRFGLEPESVAWSNDRSIVEVLRPGRAIFIPPVDGVYYTVFIDKTIAEIAELHKIDDPYVIIDSEYNNLFGATPDTLLASGERVFIPGGKGEVITWNPTVEREGGDPNSSGGDYVSFAPGQPGSCGRVQNVGGSFWSNPMNAYTITRGYASWHPGIDLAAVEGTPIYAANGGVVIFSGWNNYGYGNTIVLSHGPFTTLYGHLSSRNVSCGQIVSSGQLIGGVGNTGNSSGPHLHFELRYLDVPTNPASTIGF